MAYDAALVVVNDIRNRMAGFARGIVRALEDDRIQAYEIFSLSLQAMMFVQSVIMLFRGLPYMTAKELFYVLEHLEWDLPENQLPTVALALSLVNGLKSQLAVLARAIVDVMDDEKITTAEVISIFLGQGPALTQTVLMLFQGVDQATAKAVLYVLEHGTWVLPNSQEARAA